MSNIHFKITFQFYFHTILVKTVIFFLKKFKRSLNISTKAKTFEIRIQKVSKAVFQV
jgi:hypothetical protein